MSSNHDLRERLGTVFPDLDVNNPHRRRTAHENLFQSIKSTGQTRYEHWEARQSDGDNQAPWRKLLKRRAEVVVTRAVDCGDSLANESEWRLKLEPLIFARFETELLWQAEHSSFSPSKPD